MYKLTTKFFHAQLFLFQRHDWTQGRMQGEQDRDVFEVWIVSLKEPDPRE